MRLDLFIFICAYDLLDICSGYSSIWLSLILWILPNLSFNFLFYNFSILLISSFSDMLPLSSEIISSEFTSLCTWLTLLASYAILVSFFIISGDWVWKIFTFFWSKCLNTIFLLLSSIDLIVSIMLFMPITEKNFSSLIYSFRNLAFLNAFCYLLFSSISRFNSKEISLSLKFSIDYKSS